MYSVIVRGHMMIAHSLRGEVFGAARQLHGATYIVDVEFRRAELDGYGIVIDIGRATEALNSILGALSYRNLDDDAAFTGQNTTTEFLARVVFDRLIAAIGRGDLGETGRALASIKVTLQESHIAAAAYDGRVIDAIASA